MLGLAHIGVPQWFEEHHIPVDRLSGTSMGAFVGGLYATGRSPAEMRKLALTTDFLSVVTFETPYTEVGFRRRQDRREVPQSFVLKLNGGPSLRNSLLDDGKINELLAREFFAYHGKDLDFNRLPIPFRCVASDLNTLLPVVFTNGPVAQAVRASISLPGVFPPVQNRDGHFLIDGGIQDNLPTDVLRESLHADIVIAIRVEPVAASAGDTGSVARVLTRAFSVGIANNEIASLKLADVVVNVPVDKFTEDDYAKVDLLIDAGYKAAEASRDALMRYALPDGAWNAYLSARNSRREQPGVLREVRVEGEEPEAVRQVMRDIKPAQNKPAAPAAILNSLKNIQSAGYTASFETVTPAADSAATAPTGTGIVVHLRKSPEGPPFLFFGPELAAATSNVSRAELNLRLVDQNLGGLGSEFRAAASLGYMTGLSAEYYRLLDHRGFFIQPSASLIRRPVYLWADQKRTAERSQEDYGFGLEAGRTISNFLQLSTEWQAQQTKWSARFGTEGGPNLKGTAQTGLFHVEIDRAATATISPSGYRLTASAGVFFHAEASDNAPLLKFDFHFSHPLGEKNILGLNTEVDSYLRTNVAQPFRFTLGGPFRLSASSFDEYRGTDIGLARASFLHRFESFRTGPGHGVYGVIGYEAGEIWSPETRAILRQDGTAGLVINTAFGVMTLGGAVGDAGHRKMYITLGRWF